MNRKNHCHKSWEIQKRLSAYIALRKIKEPNKHLEVCRAFEKKLVNQCVLYLEQFCLYIWNLPSCSNYEGMYCRVLQLLRIWFSYWCLPGRLSFWTRSQFTQMLSCNSFKWKGMHNRKVIVSSSCTILLCEQISAQLERPLSTYYQ